MDSTKRVPLAKQSSEGTLKLNLLRRRLEELEALKSNALLQEEIERKRLRDIVNARYHDLRSSFDESLGELRRGLELVAASPPSPSSVLVPGQGHQEERFEPSAGREAALALGWIDRGMPPGEMDPGQARTKILEECAFLERQALAAKVMANVSLQQKKLLNLSFSWLRTFLPHCLAKINRVSFGLLTEEDCEQVLRDDPLVPRSRLKLAVPFVGKDVPSTSSEFAHPDIILGLTILAYRYSGLRRSDFNDVIDSLTSEFSREIGPAKDRPSSRRHETWVLESGGTLRGLHSSASSPALPAAAATTKSLEEDEDEDSKEVVQLKFLSKSNQEQMEKLFNLWKLEPHTIHHYLGRFIFPAYMRHQRSKISASGQSVGGDMLFGKRVGFSGTPSDLLPRELGKCSYEMGDEGKMLSTVLDREITSYQHLPADWTVEALLDTIATAKSPCYHALIDTGALVTGYSNQQVAQELLKRGLGDWCDGVVFLDENDMKKVLVKDTGRVVPADQCGIPLERRFAFYDQIHTTGMDIQHVVNAQACVTLGKDLVLRDLLQGVYRMRGIGTGQNARIFITPEVANLIQRELKACAGDKPPIQLPSEGQDPVLTEVVAWLVINSMRSEMTQWSMLCLQNVTNVYRKNAFRNVLRFGLEDSKSFLTASKNDVDAVVSSSNRTFLESLEVFDEPIDFSLDSTVPDPVPFSQKLRELLDEHSAFVETPEQRLVADSVLEEVAKYSATDGRTMERLDSEQEREQEQEQEKEVRSKREQEIEIEKFVDREYTRSDETQKAWHVSALLDSPAPHEHAGGHPFFPLKEFKLRYGEPLQYPEFMACSRNYFNPNWTGLRRVKNVVMALEYSPDYLQLRQRSALDTFADSVLDEAKSLESFEKAFTLLASNRALTPVELKSAIRAATDVVLTDAEIASLVREFGNPAGEVDREGLKAILTSGKLVHEVEDTRYFVALSLAEAETMRRIIHMQREGESLLGASSGSGKAQLHNVQVALRYIPMQTLSSGHEKATNGEEGSKPKDQTGLVFDVSRGWRRGTDPQTGVSPYQALAAHSSLRFLDCAQHFTDHALNVLVRCLQRDFCHTRELFFQTTIGARRRMERKWQETPLSKLFTMANEWSLLKLHATAVFIRQALASKGLFLYEAYTAFDFDDNGVLTPAEFFGAMRFLGLPDVTAEDVVDMIEAADRNDDGVIDYREYLDMLKEGGALAEGDLEDEGEAVAVVSDSEEEELEDGTTAPKKRPMPSKVEPYGADQLREIITLRRRETAVRQRKDRARRQAYQQAVDIKVFEAELRASRERKGGSNPSVLPGYKNMGTCTVFRFNANEAPIRMQPSGKWKFAALRHSHALASKKVDMLCNQGHVLVQDFRYWDSCVVCSRMQTKYRCNDCNGYSVCQKCHARSLEESRRRAEDIADKLTYAHIYGGCSFSLQVPSASLGLSVAESEQEVVIAAAESLQAQPSPQVHEGDDGEGFVLAAPSPLFEVKSERFSVSLEARFERLPPKGHCTALVRFFPSTFGRSRSRHLASVYLTHRGRVVGFNRLGEDELDAPDEACLVKANVWHVITMVVDAHEGLLKCFVDGKLSTQSHHLDPDSLTLRHQLVVLGGGKQAQARGGHVHRLCIHDTPLTAEQVAAHHQEAMAQFNTHVVWFVSPGTQPGNAKQELVDAGFCVSVCESVAQALASIKPHTKCVVVTLADVAFPFCTRPVAAAVVAPTTTTVLDENGNVPVTKKKSSLAEITGSLFLLGKMARAVNPSMVVVADTSCMTNTVGFRVNDRVSARWSTGSNWYPGKITQAHENMTYDVAYDDGSYENGKALELIRAESSTRLNPPQLYVQEKAKLADAQSAYNDAELRDRLFGCEVEFLKRSKA